MSMNFENLFPTVIAVGTLSKADSLNKKLSQDIENFPIEDKMGKEWSKENYKNGYTSYASLSDMHHRSPSFMDFQKSLQPHVEKFAKAQGWDLSGFELEMTACWMNVMGKGTYHTLHHHPQSVVSGVYYVSTPSKSSPLKLEDPRIASLMHSPLQEHYVRIPAKAGQFVLFPSWVRHEVPPNESSAPRVCISFNYDLTPKDG